MSEGKVYLSHNRSIAIMCTPPPIHPLDNMTIEPHIVYFYPDSMDYPAYANLTNDHEGPWDAIRSLEITAWREDVFNYLEIKYASINSLEDLEAAINAHPTSIEYHCPTGKHTVFDTGDVYLMPIESIPLEDAILVSFAYETDVLLCPDGHVVPVTLEEAANRSLEVSLCSLHMFPEAWMQFVDEYVDYAKTTEGPTGMEAESTEDCQMLIDSYEEVIGYQQDIIGREQEEIEKESYVESSSTQESYGEGSTLEFQIANCEDYSIDGKRCIKCADGWTINDRNRECRLDMDSIATLYCIIGSFVVFFCVFFYFLYKRWCEGGKKKKKSDSRIHTTEGGGGGEDEEKGNNIDGGSNNDERNVDDDGNNSVEFSSEKKEICEDPMSCKNESHFIGTTHL